MEKIKITGCIVLYNNNIEELQISINSILDINIDMKIFLIDNSPTDFLKKLDSDFRIEYIHNPSNPGFGKTHNIAIKKSIILGSCFHFVVNPDISFKGDIITPMINYMEKDKTIGMMMPQILNLDGSVQNLPKLLPTPLSMFMRKVKFPKWYYKKIIDKYELRFISRDKIYNAPVLSGCFTLLNIKAIKEIGSYDDNFFMYFEDWDLSRRMHKKYKTIYFPKVSVYHGYDSGANKSRKLFKIFIKSAFTYFNKWGWFVDSERSQINMNTLYRLK